MKKIKNNSNQEFKRTKKLYKAIKVNIKRRTVIVDDKLVFYKNVPVPSWIELSIIDVCNRSCSFCPKSDPKVAPDTFQKMNMVLIDRLANNLKKMNFKGSVVLCGYGEPMLHKNVYEISKKLAEVSFVEIVTNGDTLNAKNVNKLYNSNVNKLLISLYDGPDQVTKFKKIIQESDVPKDFVILRDRWHDSSKDYGLKLTNRTGTINVGNQENVGTFTYCNYPSYSVLIDWNGDVFLCPQDWQRRVTMGNVMQEDFFNIWTGSTISKYRKNLLEGKRCNSPCTECNAEGTILGKQHAEAWKNTYKNNFKS
jgi:radical SAM protein with 4Fe4S-binding SPASM domain